MYVRTEAQRLSVTGMGWSLDSEQLAVERGLVSALHGSQLRLLRARWALRTQ
jgi:hypothetical protein